MLQGRVAVGMKEERVSSHVSSDVPCVKVPVRMCPVPVILGLSRTHTPLSPRVEKNSKKTPLSPKVVEILETLI